MPYNYHFEDYFILLKQVELALAYQVGADEGTEVVGESDDVKAEISSGLLSGRTRDDEPTCTVFAYDEMYLGSVRSGRLTGQAFSLTNSASRHSSSRCLFL
jgi:hypothetical protein